MTMATRHSARVAAYAGLLSLLSGCHHVYRVGPYPCGAEKLKVAFHWETSSSPGDGPVIVGTTLIFNLGTARAKSGVPVVRKGYDETGRYRDSAQENTKIELAPPSEVKVNGISSARYALMARTEVEAFRFRNCIDEYHAKIYADSIAASAKEEGITPWYIAEINYPRGAKGKPDAPTQIDFGILAKPVERARLSGHFVRMSGILGEVTNGANPDFANVVLADEKNLRRVSLWYPLKGSFTCKAGQRTTFTGVYTASDERESLGQIVSEKAVNLECK